MATAPALDQQFDPPEGDNNNEPPPRDFEAEARQHGWTPKEDFKGDEARWIDAETFVKRADEVMPLLKKKTAAQERKIADLERTLRAVEAHMSKTETRMYNRALADLEARQLKAVEEGDVEAHKAIGKEIAELKDDVTAKKPDAVSDTDVTDALIDWREANPWYDEGGLAKDYADLLAEKHKAKTADMPPSEFFAFIAEETLKRFPDAAKPKQERKKPVNPVEAPSAPGTRRGEKSYDNLPADAKAACDRLHSKGILKGPGGKALTQAEARAQYCRDFDWS
jgi:hypothetical protein